MASSCFSAASSRPTAVVLLVVRAKVFEPRRRQFGVAGHKAISDGKPGSGQKHSSLAGGNAEQTGMDGVMLPAPPLDPYPPLDPDAPLDPDPPLNPDP